MTHLIDNSALVAEIERLKSIQLSIFSKGESIGRCYDSLTCISVYNEILSFINSIEVKDVDLEEKATQLSQKYFPDEENIWARANIEAQKCKSACIEMVEWLKAQKGK